MTSTDWAAWVQAIGTIIAVGIAIAVPWWETRIARASSRRDKEQQREAVLLTIFPELLDLRHWTQDVRRFFAETTAVETVSVNLSRSIAVSEIPELLDRFADRLILLGGQAAQDAIQVLAAIRALRRQGKEWFGDTKEVHLDLFAEEGRPRLVAYQKHYVALDRLLMSLVTTLARDHPRFADLHPK